MTDQYDGPALAQQVLRLQAELAAWRAEGERLRMAEAEAMAVVYSLEGTVQRLRAQVAELQSALADIAGGICCGCCKPDDPSCDVGRAKDALKTAGSDTAQ